MSHHVKEGQPVKVGQVLLTITATSIMQYVSKLNKVCVCFPTPREHAAYTGG